MTEKLIKACPEDACYRMFKPVKITYVRTVGVKKGECVCSKGVYFRELTRVLHAVLSLMVDQNVKWPTTIKHHM